MAIVRSGTFFIVRINGSSDPKCTMSKRTINHLLYIVYGSIFPNISTVPMISYFSRRGLHEFYYNLSGAPRFRGSVAIMGCVASCNSELNRGICRSNLHPVILYSFSPSVWRGISTIDTPERVRCQWSFRRRQATHDKTRAALLDDIVCCL
jgi:hypothetical protein